MKSPMKLVAEYSHITGVKVESAKDLDNLLNAMVTFGLHESALKMHVMWSDIIKKCSAEFTIVEDAETTQEG